MKINARNKGKRGELEVVNLLKRYGYKAKRIGLMESNGIDKGDVKVDLDIERIISCKIGDKVPKFIYDAMRNDEDFVFMRRNREKWIVAMDSDTFIFLLNNLMEQVRAKI